MCSRKYAAKNLRIWGCAGSKWSVNLWCLIQGGNNSHLKSSNILAEFIIHTWLPAYESNMRFGCVFLCLYICMTVFWGTIHPFPLYGGPLSGRSIVDVPCPLPGDIHHRGAPDHPQPLLSKPRGSALMRARSPHPSRPYGDYLLYSTRNREITPEPQLHKATKIKYSFNYFIL